MLLCCISCCSKYSNPPAELLGIRQVWLPSCRKALWSVIEGASLDLSDPHSLLLFQPYLLSQSLNVPPSLYLFTSVSKGCLVAALLSNWQETGLPWRLPTLLLHHWSLSCVCISAQLCVCLCYLCSCMPRLDKSLASNTISVPFAAGKKRKGYALPGRSGASVSNASKHHHWELFCVRRGQPLVG